eukprot:CAMPEP_0170869902 /NCGR_PEP_ID=MMETSP0734-20130129/24693_1 /TAXON_ID=186038 /ORGANISM="Fragilariopsis kerguelensis, Strain L26-C5" /LENGTH=73 /DNA_ID=CAMNT_0011248477 /DNA_START=82 /DNA_END=303 /DNA_ORIENTATION=+
MVAENKVETRIRSGRASEVGTNPNSAWVDNSGITVLPTRSRSTALEGDDDDDTAVPVADAGSSSCSWEECRTS